MSGGKLGPLALKAMQQAGVVSGTTPRASAATLEARLDMPLDDIVKQQKPGKKGVKARAGGLKSTVAKSGAVSTESKSRVKAILQSAQARQTKRNERLSVARRLGVPLSGTRTAGNKKSASTERKPLLAQFREKRAGIGPGGGPSVAALRKKALLGGVHPAEGLKSDGPARKQPAKAQQNGGQLRISVENTQVRPAPRLQVVKRVQPGAVTAGRLAQTRVTIAQNRQQQRNQVVQARRVVNTAAPAKPKQQVQQAAAAKPKTLSERFSSTFVRGAGVAQPQRRVVATGGGGRGRPVFKVKM